VSAHEVRKLEFFANGNVGFASTDVSSHGTFLAEGSVPPLEVINPDPQFGGVATTAAEFERLWKLHALTSRLA
jgi:hypothetical protein